MIGRTPIGIKTIRPLANGVIADFEMTEHMHQTLHEKPDRGRKTLSYPKVAVCVPACVTEVEKRAVVEVTLAAGQRKR